MTEPDIEGFDVWFREQGYADTYVKKTRRCVAALARGDVATTARKVRDFKLAKDSYNWFAEDQGLPRLRIEIPDVVEASARPKGRRRPGSLRYQGGKAGKVAAFERKPWHRTLKALEARTDPASVVLLVLGHQGLRVGDVLRTERSSIFEALKRDDHLCTLTLKGGKPYLARLTPALPWWQSLYGWMRARGGDNVASVVTRSGNPDPSGDGAAYKAIGRRLKSVGKACGLEGAQVHRIRHTVAVELREMGLQKAQIKEVLGHDDVKTTEIYTWDGEAPLVAEHLKRLKAWREAE
jgi:integrase